MFAYPNRLISGAARAARLAGIFTLVGALSGCAVGERFSFGRSDPEPPPAASGPMSAPQPGGVGGQPPVDMRGRWTFSSPGAGGCAMNFGAAPGAADGTIAPEGGCPGAFFTSRKWAFERDQLVIRDHTGKTLAQLAFAAQQRFDGQAATGQPVSLGR